MVKKKKRAVKKTLKARVQLRSRAKKKSGTLRRKKTSRLRVNQAKRWLISAFAVLGTLTATVVIYQTAKESHLTKWAERVDQLERTPASLISDSKLLSTQFLESQFLSRPERVRFWSKWILKDSDGFLALNQSQHKPENHDTAPWIPAKLDCTTFVETVVSLARSSSDQSFFSELKKIRYRNDQTSFLSRNHFPEVDWVPNTIEKGILKDITGSLSQRFLGISPGIVEKMIDRGKWYQHLPKERELASIDKSNDFKAWSNPVKGQVHYISVEDLKKISQHIPQGAVLNLVRENQDRQPVLITHQGFVIQENNKTYFRHAQPPGRIKNTELIPYIEKVFEKEKKWKLLGVQVLEIQ